MSLFDLEQEIMNCWHITEDLNVLLEEIYEGDPKMSLDRMGNIVLGMRELYEIKFNKLFRTYEHHLQEFHKYRESESIYNMKNDLSTSAISSSEK